MISLRPGDAAALREGASGGGSGSLSSAEVYDPGGLGFDPNWQPLLTTVWPSILPDGSELFKQVPNECSLQQGLAFGVFARTRVSRNLRRKKHSNNSGFLPIPPNFVAHLFAGDSSVGREQLICNSSLTSSAAFHCFAQHR